MLKGFYNNFHLKILKVDENADRVTGERLLGQDHKTGKNVYAKIGRLVQWYKLAMWIPQKSRFLRH